MMCEKIFILFSLKKMYLVFFKKFDFDPDPEMDPETNPELSEKSNPDPEIIFSAPTH